MSRPSPQKAAEPASVRPSPVAAGPAPAPAAPTRQRTGPAAPQLADPRLAEPGNARAASDALRGAQRAQGNDAVARALGDRSSGAPLPADAAAEHGARFGRSFDGVRVHTDRHAAGLAKSVGAKAFTRGQDIYFGAGRFAPGTQEGKRLLGHELAHVAQHQNARGGTTGSPEPALESEARAAATRPAAEIRGRAAAGALLRDPEGEEEDPFEGWKPAGGLAVVGTGDRVFVVPASGLLYTPSKEALERYRTTAGRMPGDAGALLGVPAAGASATRVVQAGRRTAIVLDAGSGTGTPSAMYLSQVQALFGRLGVSEVSSLRVIHVHTDHVNEIPTLVRGFGVAPENVHIPEPFLRGTTRRPLQQAINALRAGGPAWQAWNPSAKITNKSGSAEWTLTRYTQGDIRIESVALTSALNAVNLPRTDAKGVDRASFLTKVVRVTDGASVLVLGDVRFADMPLFERAMGAAKFNEFLKGVETLSGFSHHAGRFEAGDIAGLQRVLDETLLKTGRLRVLEQTDPTGPRGQTRRDTLEMMQQLGIEVSYTGRPTAGAPASSAVVSRDGITTTGPDARQLSVASSPLTDAVSRLRRLEQAGETIRNWRGLAESRGAKAAEIDLLLTQIDQSTTTLRTSLRTTVAAAGRVRAEGTTTAAGGRDYGAGGGQPGAAFQTALTALPQTTPAETTLGADGFQQLSALRARSTSELPLQVAMELALRNGVYNDTAFRFMLTQIDPATRNSILYGKRGGLRPQRVAFERLKAQFGFQQAVLPSGQFSFSGFSPRGRVAAKGLLGFMAFLEVANMGAELKHSIDVSNAANRKKNVAPFLRRILFWNQLGIRPRIVGVDDDVFVEYEHDYDKVIAGLADGEWDGLYIEHGNSGPAISDADILVLGLMLTQNVRNYDEFATLFLDSGQDAVHWESPEEGGWDRASWQVKVGSYETSGSNHVTERWVELPKLTQLMNVFTSRIIANTEELLEKRGKGEAEGEDSTSELGGLAGWARKPTGRARLKADSASSTVYLRTLGRTSRHLAREVTWWSPPVFHVHDDRGGDWTVSGADYNTFAVLRRLKTESTQLYMGGPQGRQWEETETVGNEGGTVSMPGDQLEKIEEPAVPPAPIQPSPEAASGAPSALEAEAEAAGERSVLGLPIHVGGQTPAAPALLRAPDPDPGSPLQPTWTADPPSAWAIPLANPLAPYRVLAKRAPQTFADLSAAAQTLEARAAGMFVLTPPGGATSEVLEASLPAQQLIEPLLPSSPMDDLRTRLWPIVTDPQPIPELVADEVSLEITRRWSAANPDLVGAQVRIRVIEGAGLAFDLDGEPIPSADGSLPLIELDALGSNNLETIVGEVMEEALTVGQAGDLYRTTQTVVDTETDWWYRARQDWDTVSQREVLAHYSLFRITLHEDGPASIPLGMSLTFFLNDHPEFLPELEALAVRLSELSGWVHQDFQDYFDYFDAMLGSSDLVTMREGVNAMWDNAGELWDDHPAYGVFGYIAAGLGSGLYHIGNTFSGGYSDTRYKGVQAFKRGEISMDRLDELTDAAMWRGIAVGAVMAALTIATAGLAGPVLGTAASVGSKVAFGMGAGFVTTLGGEVTGTAVSAAADLDDPTTQAIWKEGVHSPGQILANSALGGLGGGLGAGVGIAFGKLVSSLRGAFRLPAPTGSATGELLAAGTADDALAAARPLAPPAGAARAGTAPTVPGWQGEVLPDGAFRYTRPDAPGEVIVANGRIAYRVPTPDGVLEVANVALDDLAASRAASAQAAATGGTAARTALTAPARPVFGPAPKPAPALPPARPRLALPAPANLTPAQAAQRGLVWANPRTGVYHAPGSRWYGNTQGGRYVTQPQAQALGLRAVGQRPPSGVYSVARPPLGDRRIEIRAWVQARQARAGYEQDMASAAEYGLERLAGMERGHTTGAGLGAEAREAIRLETRFVNQTLKRLGVERTIKEQFRALAPGERLHLTTATQTHPGTLRLKLVEYKVEIVAPDGSRELAFVAWIEQGPTGKATWGVERVGAAARANAR